MSWIRAGVTYKKILSRESEWGPAKVHIGKYDKSTGGWEPICRSLPLYGIGMGYEVIADTRPTSCKKCFKKGVDKEIPETSA